MKKLFLTLCLFTLFFNLESSFAESLGGKGLRCEFDTGRYNYWWFEDSQKVLKPSFEGTSINWKKDEYRYSLDGTNKIIIRRKTDFIYWDINAVINRETLMDTRNKWQCSVIFSKSELINELNNIIKNAKSKNKI